MRKKKTTYCGYGLPEKENDALEKFANDNNLSKQVALKRCLRETMIKHRYMKAEESDYICGIAQKKEKKFQVYRDHHTEK